LKLTVNLTNNCLNGLYHDGRAVHNDDGDDDDNNDYGDTDDDDDCCCRLSTLWLPRK